MYVHYEMDPRKRKADDEDVSTDVDEPIIKE
jgi:hypothetical protein